MWRFVLLVLAILTPVLWALAAIRWDILFLIPALLTPVLMIWLCFDSSLRRALRSGFPPLNPKKSGMACPAAFLILGLFLAVDIPNFNDIYSSMYTNWNTETALAIRAFHWPPYVWPLLFSIPAIIIYGLGRFLDGARLRLLNILSWLAFAAVLVIILYWASSFALPHVGAVQSE